MNETERKVSTRYWGCCVASILMIVFCYAILHWGYYEFVSYRIDSWSEYQSGAAFTSTSASGVNGTGEIYFSNPCTGNGDIYKIDALGSTPIRITNAVNYEANPVVNFGGSHLAFSRETAGYQHVWLRHFESGQEVQITNEYAHDAPRIISHDARFILISRSTGTSFGGGLVEVSKLVQLDEGHPITHDLGSVATMAPDTNTVAYTEDLIEIRYRAMGDENEQPTVLPVKGIPLQFSLGGKHLLYIKNDGNHSGSSKRELWVLDVFNDTFEHVADGDNAVFFGLENQQIAVFRNNEIDISDLKGKSSRRIARDWYILPPRSTANFDSVLFTEFKNIGEPQFRIIRISNGSKLSTVFELVGCTSSVASGTTEEK